MKRLPLKLPVTVRGVDIDGNSFKESTTTMDLSPTGANFHMVRPVPMGADLILLIDPGTSDLKLKASVVRCAEAKKMMSIGAVFK